MFNQFSWNLNFVINFIVLSHLRVRLTSLIDFPDDFRAWSSGCLPGVGCPFFGPWYVPQCRRRRCRLSFRELSICTGPFFTAFIHYMNVHCIFDTALGGFDGCLPWLAHISVLDLFGYLFFAYRGPIIIPSGCYTTRLANVSGRHSSC